MADNNLQQDPTNDLSKDPPKKISLKKRRSTLKVAIPNLPGPEENVYGLGYNCFLRKLPETDSYRLQKRECTLRINEWEMKQLVDIRQTVDSATKDFLLDKEVKLTQHLGGLIYVSVQTPYYSVDLSKFWIVPETDKLHPTKIGIPMTFDEYRYLLGCLSTMHPLSFE